MEKIWKKVSYDNRYSVSNFGEVKNDERNTLLKSGPANNGYVYCIFKNKKKVAVHRLVAEHFLNNNFPKACVDHIDGNKLNNRVDNLQWMTLGGNVRKKYLTKIVAKNLETGEKMVFETQTDAGKFLGCGQGTVGHHLKGETTRIYNWKLEYE